ncbi:hypothetical protein T281_01605 [Rhodomicrobium udaipurense JA643]|nr:hypothetical protein T281_01605 [Rhodomicrobium udaipurense JA643]
MPSVSATSSVSCTVVPKTGFGLWAKLGSPTDLARSSAMVPPPLIAFAAVLAGRSAAPRIEGLPADIVMADTVYDSDRLRDAIAEKGAVAVIPNNPSRASWTNISMPS